MNARLPHHLARLVLLSVVLVMAMAPGVASASVLRMDVDDLAREADAVVVVSVRDTSHRDAAAGRLGRNARPDIVTDIDLSVTRVIAGSRPAGVTVVQPGGTIGDLTLSVSDYPVFSAGERCVLFLDEQDRVIGGYQGKLGIERDGIAGLGISVNELARRVAAYRDGRDPAMTSVAVPLASDSGSAIMPQGVAPGEAGALTLAAPSIASITPTKQIAGVGDTVTINGSGFGASAGDVEFTDGLTLPAERRAATVVSWTDTRIVVEVPQYAASGPVYVTTTGGLSAQLTYDVNFSTSGLHFGSLPVTYRINENTADMAGEATEIRKAFDTWNNCGSAFRLEYGGATTQATYPTPSPNSVNEMYFSAAVPSGMIAVNRYWYNGSAGTIIESDIAFNDDELWAASAAGSAIDLQSVALHELGHSVGLDDQYTNTWRVMGAAVWGVNKRVLTADEIAGALYLYGDGTPVVTPTLPVVSSTSHPVQSTWYQSSAVSLAFPATDAASYSYVIDSAATTDPDTTAETSASSLSTTVAQGDRWFHVRGISAAGVAGPTAHYRLRIDATPPVTTSTAKASYTATASITLASSDALSGVAATYVSLDGAPMATYTGAISVAAEGAHVLRFYSVDRAGNVETVKQADFTVDISDEPVLPPVAVSRVAGADRYVVAANVAREAFPEWSGVTDVVVTSGEDRAAADPLSAAGLAGAYDAPVLLVKSVLVNGKLPSSTESALSAIRSANGGSVRIHVVGGTSTIPSAVWNRLSALKGPSGSIDRIAGADRYALSAAIAARVISVAGVDSVQGVLIANGADAGAYYDALAASPIAYRSIQPMLLVKRTGVSSSVTYLLNGVLADKPRVVVNASGWVSESVRLSVGADERLATSTDRRTAARQIADSAITRDWLLAEKVAVANKLPDALTGGSAMGRLGGPLLYTDAASLCDATESWLLENRPTLTDAYVVGGVMSVSDAALAGIQDAVE